ncbi:MAG TPA: GntR family transcriptional regulator [Desulfuromonadaceae bacterium]|jgi:GntR family transcriptional regulator
MLDYKSPIPLHYQLRSTIENRIESGQWKPGDRVPSEFELGEEFHISRTTVRQALGDLVNQGLLTRLKGRGTFVSQPRIQQHLTRLTSFTQDMHARGKQPGAKTLQLEVVISPAHISKSLQVELNEPVILLKRLRMADGVPMAVETAFLSHRLCSPLLEEDLSQGSLYELLRRKLKIIPSHASQSLESVLCPRTEAQLLGITKGSPVLSIRRVTYGRDGLPFETVESYYRGDRYIFYAELSINPVS